VIVREISCGSRTVRNVGVFRVRRNTGGRLAVFGWTPNAAKPAVIDGALQSELVSTFAGVFAQSMATHDLQEAGVIRKAERFGGSGDLPVVLLERCEKNLAFGLCL
jgi:hypothetical protein